ncbi:IS66 family insertion sequence element accessory protein TnpB [Bradyrhizobium sp. 26S5]|uniref:IS66 family insertion sequence element accessory protein TnpB n=1 Tax=Bradyrhizobium sp. 26S5 TaxID=3139729 RepID=UPI0039C86A4B
MIPSGVKVFLASHPVDFRKGIDGLVALVRDAGSDPFDGALYVFRAKRAQHSTFCIQSSKREDCVSVASAFWADASGGTVPTRQGAEMHLHRGAAWV